MDGPWVKYVSMQMFYCSFELLRSEDMYEKIDDS